MAVVRQLADPLAGVQFGELLGVVGAFDRLLEGFGRRRRVFPLHVVAEGLLLGGVPGLLAFVQRDAVLGLQFGEVLGQALRQR
ncbi:hypothetical protein FQZ97_978800 [compost metagenome]